MSEIEDMTHSSCRLRQNVLDMLSNGCDVGEQYGWVEISLNGSVRTRAVTVATLPAAATAGAGARHFVTDSNSTTFAAIVAGGGGNGVPVYSDGTNWRIG